MAKLIQITELSESLHLSECTDGFWLWDETRQMNLAFKSKSSTIAFVEALQYYQDRLTEVEADYLTLDKKVKGFLAQFEDES